MLFILFVPFFVLLDDCLELAKLSLAIDACGLVRVVNSDLYYRIHLFVPFFLDDLLKTIFVGDELSGEAEAERAQFARRGNFIAICLECGVEREFGIAVIGIEFRDVCGEDIEDFTIPRCGSAAVCFAWALPMLI